MSEKPKIVELIPAVLVGGICVIACVQVLIAIASNPVGLTVMCLIAALGFVSWITTWIGDRLHQRRQ